MNPRLLEFVLFGRRMHIPAYEAFLFFAFSAGVLLAIWDPKRRRTIRRHVVPAMAIAVVGGWTTSRLTYRIVYSGHEGLHFFGWILGATVLLLFYARARRVSVWGGLDVMIPSVLLGSAIGRIGCLFKGCCHGMAMSPPFGVFMRSREIGYAPGYYFPTQAVASLVDLLSCLLVVWVIRPRAQYRGQVAVTGILLYTTARFLMEFVRLDPRTSIGLTAPQIGALLAAVISLAARRALKRDGVAPDAPLTMSAS